MKIRRIGTITLGISLVAFGCLFLLRLFGLAISYEFILKLWPVIFIFLGCEILYFHFRSRDAVFKYDFGSFFILAMMTAFAMSMACMEIAMKYADWHMRL